MIREDCPAVMNLLKTYNSTTEYAEITLNKLLFALYLSLFSAAKGFGLYDGLTSFKILLVLSMCAWAGGMICTEYDLLSLSLCASLTALGLFTYFHTRSYTLFVWCTLIIAIWILGKELALKLYVLFFGGAFLLRTLLCLCGLSAQRSLIHNKYNLGFAVRRTLGQSHPNMLIIAYLALMMSLYCLVLPETKRGRIRFAVITLLGGVFFFVYSLSITGILSVFLFSALIVMFGGQKSVCLAQRILILSLLPAYIAFSLLLPGLLKGRVFDIIDNISNTRYSQTRSFLETYGVHLFGLDLRNMSRYSSMDNSYLYALMNFGLLTFILFNTVLFLWILDAQRDSRIGELIVAVVCLTAGLSEPFLANLSFKNPLFFLIFGTYSGFRGKGQFTGADSRGRRLGAALLYNAKVKLFLPGVKNAPGAVKALSCGFRRSRGQIAAASLAAAIAAAAAVFALYPVPKEVYCLRSESSEGEGFGLYDIYLSEEEAGELRKDRSVLLLNYAGPEEPLYRFTYPSLGRLERARGVMAAAVFAGGIVCIVFSGIAGSGCRRSGDRREE